MHEQRKFFNFSGITWRFAGYSSALLIGFCLVITQTTSRWQEEEIRARLEEKGQVLVSVLVRTCADFLDTLNIKQLRLAAWDVSSYPEVMYIYIFDAQGRILTDGTSTNRFRNMVLADPMAQKAVQTTSMYLQYAPHLLEVCSPVYLGEKKVGGVRIGLSTRHIEQEIAALRKRNFSIGALFVLTGIGISWLAARRIVQPIVQLTKATVRLGQGEFDLQIDQSAQDEVGQLADAFQKMAVQLKTTTVSRTYLDKILQSMSNALMVVSPAGLIQTINPALSRLLGYSAAELIGQRWETVLEDTSELEPLFYASPPDSSLGPIEKTYLAKDGRRIPVLVSASYMANPIAGLVCVAEDITERKRIEEEQDAYRRLLEGMNRILQAGLRSPTEEILAQECLTVAAEITGSNCGWVGELNSEGRLDTLAISAQGWKLCRMEPTQAAKAVRNMAVRGLWAEVIRRGRPVIINEPENHPARVGVPEGHLSIRRFLGAPFYQGDRLVGMLALANKGTPYTRQDMERASVLAGIFIEALMRKRAGDQLQEYAAALKKANETSEELRTAAEFANRAKSEFLANMSHEIRTPMTAILGYADLLADSLQQPDQKEAVEIIKRNGRHLLALINDILDLSKIEAGKLSLELSVCSLQSLFAEVVSMMRVAAQSKGLALKLKYSSPVPQTIRTDPVRFRQILVNLVGNAVKFTESGEVCIQVRCIDPEGPNPRIQYEVSDTGIGMTEEHLSRLFHPFQQADASTTRRFGGTGLGLTISKRLVDALGGEITVRSAPGKGTTFTVTIPTGPLEGVPFLEHPTETSVFQAPPMASSRHCPPPTPQVQLHCRILLAEDGEDNQRLIRFLLERLGAEVEVVENGQMVLQKIFGDSQSVEGGVGSASPGGRFDLILLDMQMPLLDGYETVRRLRRGGYTGPVIALTAHAMKEDRERCLQAGCNDYLPKPIDRESFYVTVVQWAILAEQTMGRSDCVEGFSASVESEVAPSTPT